jgi:chromosome segregation ATPase
MKREVEALRKHDELSMIHATETARNSELMAALGKSEKDMVRLQMALESAQMKQAELHEAALIVEADRQAEAARAAAEMRGVRSEVQALQSRLEAATNQQRDVADELAGLRAQLNDALAEKQVADEKLDALLKEHEQDQMRLSAASANISQLALRQETEQIQLDIHKQECEDLRAEIATLNSRIKDLLPFERLYRVTKARQAEGGASVMAESTAAAVVKSRTPARRAPGSGRGRGSGN